MWLLQNDSKETIIGLHIGNTNFVKISLFIPHKEDITFYCMANLITR
jgi:hypothetical protein